MDGECGYVGRPQPCRTNIGLETNDVLELAATENCQQITFLIQHLLIIICKTLSGVLHELAVAFLKK